MQKLSQICVFVPYQAVRANSRQIFDKALKLHMLACQSGTMSLFVDLFIQLVGHVMKHGNTFEDVSSIYLFDDFSFFSI